jgi:hypothetical protein
MIAANAQRIRFATAEEADTLRRRAERGSQQPLVGRVPIGQMNRRDYSGITQPSQEAHHASFSAPATR